MLTRYLRSLLFESLIAYVREELATGAASITDIHRYLSEK